MAQLFVGLMAEGSTDYRFLKPIIEKALINLALECRGQVDVDVFDISCSKEGSFSDYVLRASNEGMERFGIMVLIIHADADKS